VPSEALAGSVPSEALCHLSALKSSEGPCSQCWLCRMALFLAACRFPQGLGEEALQDPTRPLGFACSLFPSTCQACFLSFPAHAAALNAVLGVPGKVLSGEPDGPRRGRVHACMHGCRSERHVGTAGGGMDQAVSLMAQEGCALHVRFDQLQVGSAVLHCALTKRGLRF